MCEEELRGALYNIWLTGYAFVTVEDFCDLSVYVFEVSVSSGVALYIFALIVGSKFLLRV